MQGQEQQGRQRARELSGEAVGASGGDGAWGGISQRSARRDKKKWARGNKLASIAGAASSGGAARNLSASLSNSTGRTTGVCQHLLSAPSSGASAGAPPPADSAAPGKESGTRPCAGYEHLQDSTDTPSRTVEQLSRQESHAATYGCCGLISSRAPSSARCTRMPCCSTCFSDNTSTGSVSSRARSTASSTPTPCSSSKPETNSKLNLR